jgi:hypothetical protein
MSASRAQWPPLLVFSLTQIGHSLTVPVFPLQGAEARENTGFAKAPTSGWVVIDYRLLPTETIFPASYERCIIADIR